MSIREFAQALRTTQGQHILASVLEGPEQGQRLLLCEGVPVWPPSLPLISTVPCAIAPVMRSK